MSEVTEQLTERIVRLALEEDRVADDVTTNALSAFDRRVSAAVTAKESGVISGTGVFCAVFRAVDPEVVIRVVKSDGDTVEKGDLVLEAEGAESSILKAERTALNFLQRLSGIATLTRVFADRIKDYPATLLDTRKTTPGMRMLEKKAVLDGGGTNHRMNLEEMAMVKDNHIRMAGGISAAVTAIRDTFPGKKIEVEVTDLVQLKEALSLGVDIIMLDNFSGPRLAEAVALIRAEQTRNTSTKSVKIEISGNVNLDNIAEKAASGVDYISVGALTHSFRSLDLSLNFPG